MSKNNVFEGSKTWNPEYIEVCAKKYGIKPEEVIPHYVSKTILGKETKGQDVADAVVFISFPEITDDHRPNPRSRRRPGHASLSYKAVTKH